MNFNLYSLIIVVFFIFLLFLFRKKEITKIDLKKIDNMNGLEFEHYFGKILKERNFFKVEVTKGSVDFGVDIICFNKNKKYVFQLKRYSKKVGVAAIQEIIAGKEYYKANKAIVVTNNYYTAQAIEMARKCNVLLIDRDNFKLNKFNI